MAGNFAYNKINKAFKERAKLSESSRGYQEESREGLNKEKTKEKSREESKRQKLDLEDLINKGKAAGGDKARANADSKSAGRGKYPKISAEPNLRLIFAHFTSQQKLICIENQFLADGRSNKSKSTMVIIVAIMHKLLHVVFGVIKDNNQFNPTFTA